MKTYTPMTALEKLMLIKAALAKGATVYLSTYTQATKITPKNAAKWAATGRPIVKVAGSSLYVARGKAYDCADYSTITVEDA